MFADSSVRSSRRTLRGFTLVEIMIVVLIIGVLLAIAIPNFARSRETARSKACIANLKRIDSAKEQYAMDNKLPNGNTSIAADPLNGTGALTSSGAYLRGAVTCPAGGAYTVGAIGTNPVCSYNATAAAYAPHALQ